MEKWRHGSHTVEAALIMGVVLLVIFAILEGSETVYRRAMQVAAKYETTIVEKASDSSPVTYARQVQAAKNMSEQE